MEDTLESFRVGWEGLWSLLTGDDMPSVAGDDNMTPEQRRELLAEALRRTAQSNPADVLARGAGTAGAIAGKVGGSALFGVGPGGWLVIGLAVYVAFGGRGRR